MEMAFQLTKGIYNKHNIKLRKYSTVIRPECLYAAENLAMNRKKKMSDRETGSEKKQGKILREILGLIQEIGVCSGRRNHELHTRVGKITDIIRQRSIAFYGHMTRMSPETFTNRMFAYSLSKKTKGVWFTEVIWGSRLSISRK